MKKIFIYRKKLPADFINDLKVCHKYNWIKIVDEDLNNKNSYPLAICVYEKNEIAIATIGSFSLNGTVLSNSDMECIAASLIDNGTFTECETLSEFTDAITLANWAKHKTLNVL